SGPGFRRWRKRWSGWRGAPELALASALARSSIAARTTASGYGSPTPQACDRRSRSWSSSVSSSGIWRETKRPKPVLTPYVCSCAPCATCSTTCRAAVICPRASGESSAAVRPSTATCQTSSSVRSSPVSPRVAVTAETLVPALPPGYSSEVSDPVFDQPRELEAAPPPPSRAFGLLRRADFRRLYVAVGASELGDSLHYIALMWFALDAGGPLGVVAVRLADSIPAIVFGLHA